MTYSITQEDAGDTRERSPATAATPNGNILVAWDQDGSVNGTQVGIRLVGPDGTPVTNEFFITGSGSASNPNIMAIDDDTFVVTYVVFDVTTFNFIVEAQIVSLSGSTLSAGPIVTLSNGGTGGGDCEIALMDNGDIAFAFSQIIESAGPTSATVMVRITDQNLVDRGSGLVQVSETNDPSPANIRLTTNGSQLALAWQQNQDGNTNSPALGTIVVVNNDGTIPSQPFNDIVLRAETGVDPGGYGPSIGVRDFVRLANGDYLLVSVGNSATDNSASGITDDDFIYGTIYDSSLTQIVSAFRIDQVDMDTGSQSARIVAFEGGGFAVFFHRNLTVGADPNSEIFYRVYDNTYTPTGNEIQLTNTVANLDDERPQVALLNANGDVAVIYEQQVWFSDQENLFGITLNNLDPNASVGAPPIIDINTGSTVLEGGVDQIAPTELRTTDSDTDAASLIYTIQSAATNGIVFIDDGDAVFNPLEDTMLGAGNQFNQSQINSGVLFYVHDGSETTTDSFTFSMTDGTTTITNQTFNLSVTPVNDAPVISNLNGDTRSYTEGGFPFATDPTIFATVTDSDSANFNGGSLTVEITGGFVASEDQYTLLGITSPVSISGNTVSVRLPGQSAVAVGTIATRTNSEPIVITFTTDDATPARVELILRSILYVNTNNNDPTAGDRTFTYTLVDGDGTSSGGSDTATVTSTITVVPVNDRPTVTVTGGTPTIPEQTPTAIDAAMVVADVDSPTLASATVSITANFQSGEDVLAFVNDNAASFGNIAASYDAGTGVLTLTSAGAAATVAQWQAAMRAVTYENTSTTPDTANRTIAIVVNDGALGSTPRNRTIAVEDVNNAPIANDDAFSTDEATAIGAGLNLTGDNGSGADDANAEPLFELTEVNGAAAAIGNQIVLPSGALLTVNPDGTFSYDPNGAFNATPGPSSGASNAQQTDSFTYTVTGGDTATVTITINGIDTDGDVLQGSAVGDNLNGGIGNDRLNGLEGNDTLNGSTGADTMAGGAGDDIYIVDNAGDKIDETGGSGYDTIRSSISFSTAAGVERLVLTGSADINGGGRDDQSDFIIGNAGNNFINGRGGADIMRGGLGNDTYIVDNAGDKVDEVNGGGGAIDKIFASVSFSTSTGVEWLILTGTGNLSGGGTDGQNDLIIGNDGNNLINGRSGADTMRGGLGNDTYIVDDEGDRVDEVNGGGGALDVIKASVSFTNAFGVERLILTGNSAINATGNNVQSDYLFGNGAANVLSGLGGNDVLAGGLGNDTLTGGTGTDFFRFDAAPDAVANLDTITDFNHSEDTFQFARSVFTGFAATGYIDASLFKDIASGVVDADDRILYDSTTGALYYDADGSGAGERVQVATLTNLAFIDASDFMVI